MYHNKPYKQDAKGQDLVIAQPGLCNAALSKHSYHIQPRLFQFAQLRCQWLFLIYSNSVRSTPHTSGSSQTPHNSGARHILASCGQLEFKNFLSVPAVISMKWVINLGSKGIAFRLCHHKSGKVHLHTFDHHPIAALRFPWFHTHRFRSLQQSFLQLGIVRSLWPSLKGF
jgi:hypothetical protein